jgi:hypothetical protein
MPTRLAIVLGCFFLTFADVPRVTSFRPQTNPMPVFPSGEAISLFPDSPSSTQDGQNGSPASAAKPRSATLQETSKLELIRYVSGEFAKATKALPAGKEGLVVHVGKPVETELLQRAVATHGAAVNTGDKVQITRLDFKDREIIVDLNGGGRGHKSWKDHVHIEMSGIPTTTTTQEQEGGPPGLQPGMGSTIYLDWNKAVPDLTPGDLKDLLSPFLDFARERSASVQWVDTLPPEMKKAIQERRPMVGMDREEVVAAIGKPDHKVRERDQEGNDIEDWIYGQPPSKTVFVRFNGDRVTVIRQYPQ